MLFLSNFQCMLSPLYGHQYDSITCKSNLGNEAIAKTASRITEVIFSCTLRFDSVIVIAEAKPYLMPSQCLFFINLLAFFYVVLFLDTLFYFFFKDLFYCIKR